MLYLAAKAMTSYNASNSSYPVAPTEEPRPLIPTWGIVVGVVVTLLLMGGLVALVIWLAKNYAGQIEAIRDIFIILFATAACSTVIVLIMLLVAVIRLINMLEFEIKPILEKTNETISMVQGTTTFVSANVVKPAITASSYVAAVLGAMRVLFGNPRRNLPD